MRSCHLADTTPDLTGQSLCGGGSNNKIMYMKSRNGQLMVMDDDQGTIRLNDCTGNSAIQLEKDQIAPRAEPLRHLPT